MSFVTVIGCADPVLTPILTVKRFGNKVDITCKPTAQTWTLTCDGNKWVGERGNCSDVASVFGLTGSPNMRTLPHGE